jgi:hypothetical protein
VLFKHGTYLCALFTGVSLDRLNWLVLRDIFYGIFLAEEVVAGSILTVEQPQFNAYGDCEGLCVPITAMQRAVKSEMAATEIRHFSSMGG